jgi:hypothetical protein
MWLDLLLLLVIMYSAREIRRKTHNFVDYFIVVTGGLVLLSDFVQWVLA